MDVNYLFKQNHENLTLDNHIIFFYRTRGGRSGPDYRDYRAGGGASRGYSPVRGEGPASKRLRPEWPIEERRYGGMPHDSYGSYGWAHDHFGPHPAHQGYGQPMPPVAARYVYYQADETILCLFIKISISHQKIDIPT